MLVSKTLQNMANQMRFRGNEAFLSPLNAFIDENEANLHSFFDNILVSRERGSAESLQDVSHRSRPCLCLTCCCY